MKRFFNFTTDREVEELRQAGKWVLRNYHPKETIQGFIIFFGFYGVLDAVMWVMFVLDTGKGPWDFLWPLFITVFAVGFLIAFFVFMLNQPDFGCVIADECGITFRPSLGERQYLSWENCRFIGLIDLYAGFGTRSSRGIVCSVIPLPPWDSYCAPGEYLSHETSKHIHCRRNIYVPSCDKADVEALISLWGGRKSAKEQGCGAADAQ